MFDQLVKSKRAYSGGYWKNLRLKIFLEHVNRKSFFLFSFFLQKDFFKA